MTLEQISKNFHPRLVTEYRDFTILREQHISLWCRATHQKSNSPRLIKILNTYSDTYKQDPAYYFELFYKESLNATQSQNPNAIKALDFDLSVQGERFFVAYPDLPSLRRLIDEEAEIDIVSILNDVKRALVYAKKEFGLAHGALTPENIFYDKSNGSFVVSNISFPVTQLDRTHKDFERLSQYLIKSKSEYSPPEIFQPSANQDEVINIELIDVYSLGLIALESTGVPKDSIKNFNTCKGAFYNTVLKGLLSEFSSKCRSCDTKFTNNMVWHMLQEADKRPTFDNLDLLSQTVKFEEIELKHQSFVQPVSISKDVGVASREMTSSNFRRDQSMKEKLNSQMMPGEDLKKSRSDPVGSQSVIQPVSISKDVGAASREMTSSNFRRDQSMKEKLDSQMMPGEDLKKSRSDPVKSTVPRKKGLVKILEEESGCLLTSNHQTDQKKMNTSEIQRKNMPVILNVVKGEAGNSMKNSNLRTADISATFGNQVSTEIATPKFSADNMSRHQIKNDLNEISKCQQPDPTKNRAMTQSVVVKTRGGTKTIDILSSNTVSSSPTKKSDMNFPSKSEEENPTSASLKSDPMKNQTMMSKSVAMKQGGGSKGIEILSSNTVSASPTKKINMSFQSKGEEEISKSTNLKSGIICESSEEGYLARLDLKTKLASKLIDWEGNL